MFALAGMTAVVTIFMIDQFEWPAPFGVFCTKPCTMRVDTGTQIIGDTGIEAAIATFENIDDPLHRRLHPVACFAYA